jgi:hypothetical protein
MKLRLVLSFALMFASLIFCSDVMAQRKSNKSKDPFDESGNFKSHLWYGANVGLSFGGSQNLRSFNFALFPMVGYKFTDYFSAGPRMGGSFTIIQGQTTQGDSRRVTGKDYEAGVFSRLKFLQMFFLHTEWNYASRQNFYLVSDRIFIDPTTDKPLTDRTGRGNVLVGGGYNSGQGALGYEISALYNLSLPASSEEFPIGIRVGLTYKF